MQKQAQDAAQAGRENYSEATENMSKKDRSKYDRELIKEARKRMAEKYGEEYDETEDDDEE